MENDFVSVIAKTIEKSNWDFHFQYDFCFDEKENIINRINTKELNRIQTIFVAPPNIDDCYRFLEYENILIIRGKNGSGRTAAAMMTFLELEISKIYFAEINSHSKKSFELFDFSISKAFIIKINAKFKIDETFINNIIAKLKKHQARLILVIDDRFELQEEACQTFLFELSEVEDKLQLFQNHYDFEMRATESRTVQKRFSELFENEYFIRVIKKSSPKQIYYLSKKLVSLNARKVKSEELIKNLTYNNYTYMTKHFESLKMEDKVYAILIASLEYNSFHIVNKELPNLQNSLKAFYPRKNLFKFKELEEIMHKKKEKEIEKEKEEIFQYWKYNRRYINSFFQDHLNKVKKKKREIKKYREKIKKVLEQKKHFEKYQRSTTLDRVQAGLYYGQSENEFGTIQKEYVKFSENSYSQKLLRYVLDEYYQWRDPVLTWFFAIKISKAGDYKSYYRRLVMFSTILEEDYTYFENFEKLIIKGDFENNFKISFILSNTYLKDNKNEFIKKLLKEWAKAKDVTKNTIALLAFLLIGDEKLLNKVYNEYHKLLEDSKTENEKKEKIIILVLSGFKFAENNKVSLQTHGYLLLFLHNILFNGLPKDYYGLIINVFKSILNLTIDYKQKSYSLLVCLFSEQKYRAAILKTFKHYVDHSKDLDDTFDNIKKIIKCAEDEPDTYAQTEEFIMEITKGNEGCIKDRFAYYLKKWKSEFEVAEKLLNRL